jgi:hypothetical protein
MEREDVGKRQQQQERVGWRRRSDGRRQLAEGRNGNEGLGAQKRVLVEDGPRQKNKGWSVSWWLHCRSTTCRFVGFYFWLGAA